MINLARAGIAAACLLILTTTTLSWVGSAKSRLADEEAASAPVAGPSPAPPLAARQPSGCRCCQQR